MTNAMEALPPNPTIKQHPKAHHWAMPLLILAHFIATPCAAAWSSQSPSPSLAIFISLVFSQTSLIGLWVGLGMSHWMLRFAGMTAGILALGGILEVADAGPTGPNFFLVSTATALVALVTWVARLLNARAGKASDGTTTHEAMQFHIKHLMLLTFVVALWVSVGKMLAPYVFGIDFVSVLAVIAVCFVAVALTSIWAMLGAGRPLQRIGWVPIIAGVGGWALSLAISDRPVFLTSIMLLDGAFLVLSLVVVRMAGYRLMTSDDAAHLVDSVGISHRSAYRESRHGKSTSVRPSRPGNVRVIATPSLAVFALALFAAARRRRVARPGSAPSLSQPAPPAACRGSRPYKAGSDGASGSAVCAAE